MIDTINKRHLNKKKVYTTNYQDAHPNGDYTITYGQNEYDVPDSLTFNIPGQGNVTIDANEDSYRIRWSKIIRFDNISDKTIFIYIWTDPDTYSTLNYNISPREIGGNMSSDVNNYAGEIPIDGGTQQIQEAIDHCVNDLRMESLSGGDSRYSTMVYDNEHDGFRDYYETWSVRKSHSFTDMVNGIRKSRIAKDDGPINQNIQVGDIYYVVLGYDMTTPIFYEIVGRNGSTMISYRELEEDRTYSSPRYNQGEYTTVPIPGSYYGDTSRSKVEYNEWSNDYGFAVRYAGEHWAFKWNGQPLRGNNMD